MSSKFPIERPKRRPNYPAGAQPSPPPPPFRENCHSSHCCSEPHESAELRKRIADLEKQLAAVTLDRDDLKVEYDLKSESLAEANRQLQEAQNAYSVASQRERVANEKLAAALHLNVDLTRERDELGKRLEKRTEQLQIPVGELAKAIPDSEVCASVLTMADELRELRKVVEKLQQPDMFWDVEDYEAIVSEPMDDCAQIGAIGIYDTAHRLGYEVMQLRGDSLDDAKVVTIGMFEKLSDARAAAESAQKGQSDE